MQITVKADVSPIKKELEGLRVRLKDLSPVMKQVAQIVRTSVIRNFEVGGRPKWEPSQRARKEGGMTLVKTARLRNSITARGYSDRAEVGTNVIYAAIHQLGGRTSPRVIKPKNAKALFWPGAKHPVKSVQHPGSKIPARPFLMVQDEDWTEIKNVINDYLARRK